MLDFSKNICFSKTLHGSKLHSWKCLLELRWGEPWLNCSGTRWCSSILWAWHRGSVGAVSRAAKCTEESSQDPFRRPWCIRGNRRYWLRWHSRTWTWHLPVDADAGSCPALGRLPHVPDRNTFRNRETGKFWLFCPYRPSSARAHWAAPEHTAPELPRDTDRTEHIYDDFRPVPDSDQTLQINKIHLDLFKTCCDSHTYPSIGIENFLDNNLVIIAMWSDASEAILLLNTSMFTKRSGFDSSTETGGSMAGGGFFRRRRPCFDGEIGAFENGETNDLWIWQHTLQGVFEWNPTFFASPIFPEYPKLLLFWLGADEEDDVLVESLQLINF